MFILDQDGVAFVDITAVEIRTVINNETKQIIDYNITGYSFGIEFVLARYNTENEAKMMFEKIIQEMIKGKQHFDIKEKEINIFRR